VIWEWEWNLTILGMEMGMGIVRWEWEGTGTPLVRSSGVRIARRRLMIGRGRRCVVVRPRLKAIRLGDRHRSSSGLSRTCTVW